MPNYTTPERDRVALLTVNAQRDFAVSNSPLRACGVNRALPAIGDLVSAFRERNLPIFHAVRLYRPDGSNVDVFRRTAVEEGLRVLMPGTLGVELIDSVKPGEDVRLNTVGLLQGNVQTIGPSEWIFYKPRWGAFFSTPLQEHLEQLGISTLIICGCNFATSGRATVYEAGARDFRVILASDALSGANEDSICELGRIGVYLMDARGCISWLSGNRDSNAA